MPLPRATKKTAEMEKMLSSYNSDPQINLHSGENETSGFLVNQRSKRGVASTTAVTLQEIRELFESFETNQNSKIEKLLANVSAVKSQNDDLKESMDFISKKYDDFLKKIEGLEKDHTNYKKRIQELESRVELMERNSRASLIEVKNVPKQQPENGEVLRTIIKDIGSTVGQPIVDSDVQEIYRLKSKKDNNSPIVVQFSTTALKDSVIKKCRKFNKENKENKLNTTHIKLQTQPSPKQPIFIDESLTAKARHLRYLAKDFVTANHYYSSWTAYGKVYLKEKENSPALRIDEEEDLRKLINLVK